MTTSQNSNQTDLQAQLEHKLSDIQLKEQELASKTLAEELGLPFANLSGLPIDPQALQNISEADSHSSNVALIQTQGSIAVAATPDPRPAPAKAQIEQLQAKFKDLKIIIVSPATMKIIWERYNTIKTQEVFEVGAIHINPTALAQAKDSIKNLSDLKNKLTSISTTELFEILIAGALAIKASDIHFEPEADSLRLRYRLDGLLQEVAAIDKAQYHRILNRVKVLSKMKLNITKAPQDGRFTIQEKDTAIEVRVSILPSEHGESIVMRLLDPRGIRAKLEDLGMRTDVLDKVKELLGRPQGALLTTGPTGSGKTTTLYAFLNHLNSSDTKIITVEDPIEYHITGVSQTQVEPDKGYTFASGLRAIVRQDPDIILIGEIRDLETAQIALEAALTGHMVLSTIHTNDAAGTIPRLVDLGVKPETIAPALTMAMGQRLVRRLCDKCKKQTTPDEAALVKIKSEIEHLKERFNLPALDGSLAVYTWVGCDECNGTGYKGRVGVYEVFEVTPEMEKLILSGDSGPAVTDIRNLAIKNGMVTMLQDGYLKLLQGVTSLDEIHRVLG